MLIRELGLIAAAVYQAAGNDAFAGNAPIDRQNAAGSAWDAFQAAAYRIGNEVVVAFRGTTGLGDAVTDAALGLGMNSAYYEQGAAFVRRQLAGGATSVILCGHSLGGAITQVVANRMNLQMVTFNAPGVAVLASRNIASASIGGTAVRVGGMLISSVIRPGQALQDIRATFHSVRGLNVCLSGDVVSQIGVHYGNVARIPGVSNNPLDEHRMATVNQVLAHHEVGGRPARF